jgi:hypothetical protein
LVSERDEPRLLLLLDAYCLLNLFATRHIEHILQTLQRRFAIAAAVKAEAKWIYRGGSGEDALERDTLDTEPLIAAGLLEVLMPETDAENEDYVAFAIVLGDGEAMTAALAMHRGGSVATDDVKARRELTARAPYVVLSSTADLLHEWSSAACIETRILAQALQDVRTRAQFLPANGDPLRSWWDAAIQSA